MKPALPVTLGHGVFAPLRLCVLAVLCRATTLSAQTLELGGFYHHVTNAFGDWKGVTARGIFGGARDVWYVDAKAQEAFGDRGVYGALANVHQFGSRFYTQVGIGGGSGDFVLPDLRADLSLNLKLGATRRLVVTAGGTWVDAKSGFTDRAGFGSLTWYAGSALLLEGGARFNWSDPGAVASARGYGSLSIGSSGRTLVTLRGSAGTEGYQLTGTALTQRKFRSQEAGITWRQWLSGAFGVLLGGEWYHNPFYTRAGVSAGLFRGR